MFFKINDTNFFYIHIPRTSGTHLESKIANHLNQKLSTNDYVENYNKKFLVGHYKDKNNSWHSATHFTHNEIILLKKELNLNINYLFSIIRNPLDRLASLFRYWKFNNTYEFINYIKQINIDEIAYSGCQCKFFDPKNNNEHRRYHFLSQVSYLYPLKDIQVFRITEINKISTLLNIEMMYWHWRQKKNRLDNLNLFTKKDIEQIYRIYEKDFDILKYPKEYSVTSAF